jgi:hypothetical protein
MWGCAWRIVGKEESEEIWGYLVKEGVEGDVWALFEVWWIGFLGSIFAYYGRGYAL